MSDLFKTTKKVKEGKMWRGTVNTVVEGEEVQLSVRQLVDPELQDVLGKIDMEGLKALRSDLPEEKTAEYEELADKDELTEEESERFVELEEELSEIEGNMFDVLGDETMDAFRLCAVYGVVPDNDDVTEAFRDMDYVNEVEDEYGITVKQPKDLYDPEKDGRPDEHAGPLKDRVQDMVVDMTGFASIRLGMKVFKETMGDRKN